MSLLGSLLLGEPGGYGGGGGGGGSPYGGAPTGGMSVAPSAAPNYGATSPAAQQFSWGYKAPPAWSAALPYSTVGRPIWGVIGGSGYGNPAKDVRSGAQVGPADSDKSGWGGGGPEADLGPSGGPEHESSDSESDKDSDKGT